MKWITKLENMKKELEDTVKLERRRLLMEQEMISFKLGNLEKKIQEISSLEEELENLREEKDAIKKAESEKISKEKFLNNLRERISKIIDTSEKIKKRNEETDLKLALLEDPDPHCPLCLKEMRYDEKVRVKNQLLERDRLASNLNVRNKEQLKELESKKEVIEADLREIERRLISKPVVFEKTEVIQRKIESTKDEARNLRDLEERDREIKESLKKKKYAEVAQKVLKEIDKEIKENL
jgi:DNA repair exonuclease SbcCD ATPase subunit